MADAAGLDVAADELLRSQRASNLLAKEQAVHADLVEYWARRDTDDPKERFPLTPYARVLVEEPP